MKPFAFWLFLLTGSAFFFACTKKQPIGKWTDVIQLSQKEFSFNSSGDSALVTARGKWFGISSVYLDSSLINLNIPGGDACNFTYTDVNMIIVSKSCDTLFIKLNANTGAASRTLRIGLWAGDYGDGIKIVQGRN